MPESDAAGGGRFRRYERGVIYWHPQTGAHEVHGDILAKWQSLGTEAGPLGYPLTDELDATRGGRFNHFVNGSIYWRAETGAFWLPPQIFEKWETMHWERGIGFPLSDPTDTIGGEIRQRFEKAVMIWRPQNGHSVVHQPAPLNKIIRVFLVSWSDVPPPPGFTQEFFSRYFFGVNQPITNPENEMIPASVYDYFSAVSDGFMQVSGVVMPWVTNPIRLSEIVHWAPPAQPWPRAGTVGTLGATVAQTLRTVGIRSMRDLAVNGASPDALIFIGLDVIGGGGATRNMSDVKDELRRAGRMDLWDNAWDSFLGLTVTLTSCTFQDPPPRANPDTTYPTPPPGSLRWVRGSALHHELVHALLNFYGDIYGGTWLFDTWHEVMSFSIPTDYPIPMSSYSRERSGFITIRDMPRQSHLSIILDPLETYSSAIRFQNGPMHAPEAIILENRRRFDYRHNPSPQLPNVIFAYSVDLKSRRVQSNGLRLTGRVIKRNAEWGDVWGTAPGADLVGQGQDLANTLNPAGEHWWDFRNIQVASNNQIQLDAVYKPQDLLWQYQSATWLNSRGDTLTPNISHGRQGHVIMVNRSIPILGGRRYEHVLNVHPDWNPNGSVQGVYRVVIPPTGARLYVTAALSEAALGSDGIQAVIQVNGDVKAEHALTLNRNVRTYAVDLFDVRNTIAEISVGVVAGTTAVRDWAYILEAIVVPTAQVQIDLLSLASTANWRTNSGEIRFNGEIGPQGHVREAINTPLQNGVVYGRRLLYTHPAWRADGFVEGLFPVTLPTTPSVFRAELGFREDRTVTQNGASFSLRFINSTGVETDILVNGQLTRNPAMGEKGAENNPVLAPAVPIPASLRGLTGTLVLRVGTSGSPSEDWVHWTMARITSD